MFGLISFGPEQIWIPESGSKFYGNVGFLDLME
jgi:hypothetical protein